nr:hypothetical protein Iba_chr01dCG9320 [Ipomoea batatas]
MVRARCSPREQEQGAHPGSKVPGYRSSDLNGESKVLTPGARCPVTGLRTLMVRARCSPREQGVRLPVFGPQLASVAGSALGSPSPSADGPALRVAPNSVDGPVVAAASANGPAEISTTGTGRLRPSGTEVNGVGLGSSTSPGRMAKTFGRSVSSIDTSRAVVTSFCIALRPLLKAQVPNSYIRSSPTGVREIAARTASPVSRPRQT